MAPHPMYSVGYAGYYGISLMMASYMVLFVSLFAHAAQFAFLTLVENPRKSLGPEVKAPDIVLHALAHRPCMYRIR